jgi:hypothetical protein
MGKICPECRQHLAIGWNLNAIKGEGGGSPLA